ncbi:histone deacetylase family protein [Rheinheimera sp. WS51]|uniref:histone deacetylase family protein n=1 Tax=Rheinheimera sp. WS51 TaxID=3425886 RepID=UPI003D93CD09
MAITLFSHSSCSLHSAGDHHPERPARLSEINDQLIRSGMEFIIQQRDASPASKEDLYRVHDKQLVDSLFNLAPSSGYVQIDPDTHINRHSINAALHAAGAAINAVDTVMASTNQQAFCAIRPPGHHATRSQAMGFCLFNNIAVAAAYAIEKYGLTRVAIVDFDVHHGNGTEDIFQHDPRVLLCSSYQAQLYPYPKPQQNSDLPQSCIKIALPAGCRSATWQQELHQQLLPALDAFAPELILISAGFDGHAEDEISQLLLTEADFAWLTAEIKTLAAKHCDGRIVSTLEGGYALSALGRSVVAHLKAML